MSEFDIEDRVDTRLESASRHLPCDGHTPGSYTLVTETPFESAVHHILTARCPVTATAVTFGHLPLDPDLIALMDGQLNFAFNEE